MHHRLPLLFAVIIAHGLIGCQTAAPPRASALQVEAADFGLFSAAADGTLDFTPTRTVPLVESQNYGWAIRLRNPPPRVKWREEFILPSAPVTWGKPAEGAQTVSKDRTTSVSEREVEPVDGIIFNTWAVAKGDPRGRYTIRVTIDGGEPIVFDFDVE